jgi:hypothetical protein
MNGGLAGFLLSLGASGGGAPALPAFNVNKVVLAMDCESLLDSSQYEWYFAAAGSISVSATQAKFGTHSLFLGGSGGPMTRSYPTIPLMFQAPTTLSLWIRPASVTTTQKIIGQRDTSSGNGWELIIATDGSFFFQATSAFIQTGAGALALNTWQHILVVYSSGTLYLFLNGVLLASGAFTIATSGTATTSHLELLAKPSTAQYNGYVDDIVLSSEALTTAAFTPPTTAMVPTFPGGFSAWNNADKGTGLVVSANGRSCHSSNTAASIRGSQGRAVGTSYYFEVTYSGGDSVADNVALAGIGKATAGLTSFPGADANAWGYYPAGPAQVYNNGSGSSLSGGANVSTFGVWLRSDGSLRIKTSGTDPTVNATTGLTGTWFPMWGQGSGSGVRECAINTGATTFALGLPSGATAWG